MDEGLKELFIELYHLQKSPDWTLEKQLELNDKIMDYEKT